MWTDKLLSIHTTCVSYLLNNYVFYKYFQSLFALIHIRVITCPNLTVRYSFMQLKDIWKRHDLQYIGTMIKKWQVLGK